MTLTVWCSESELQEYGEVIEIGDRLHRTALPWEPPFLPSGSARWALDRYAFLAADPVRISGVVSAIEEVRAVSADDAGTPTDLHLLPATLADGRVWPRRTRAPDPGEGVPDGRGGRWVPYRVRAGDELHLGWLLHLRDAAVDPAR